MEKELCKSMIYENMSIENCINLYKQGFSCECNADEQCICIYDRGDDLNRPLE